MLRGLLILFVFVTGLQAKAAVWEDVNDWSPSWEQRYSEWVRNNWNIEFFARRTLPNGQNNPYYGLQVDCADTVYSMRIVFAYENGLPFVMQDPSASGKTISNKMSRWDRENRSERIRFFLRYIHGIASTRSLPNDTYPVRLDRNNVRPGGLILTVKKNHHSWTIKDILSIGVPYLVYNSVVGAHSSLTIQERQSWPNPGWVFEGDQTPAGNAGIRYWRPAAYLNRPVWETPGYSEEQYNIPLKKWVRFAQDRLAIRKEGDSAMIERLTNTVCVAAKARVDSVQEGLDYLAKKSSCMDYATYDNYSTPNRDQRLFDDYMALRRAYQDIMHTNNGNELSTKTKTQLNKIFPFINSSAESEMRRMAAVDIDSNSICVINYGKGKSMDLAEMKRRIFAGLLSNNPMDGFDYRWGIRRGPSPQAAACPSWGVWTPVFND